MESVQNVSDLSRCILADFIKVHYISNYEQLMSILHFCTSTKVTCAQQIEFKIFGHAV